MRFFAFDSRYARLVCIAAALFPAFASIVSHAQTATDLYSFKGTGDGRGPVGELVADSSGNLYGTTFGGGNQYCGGGCGVVFELSPVQGGGWTYTVLYEFAGRSYGQYPQSGLLLNPSTGDLFGTAEGGRSGSGIVFSLHQSGGTWKEGIVYHFFGGPDGNNPAFSGLIADSSFHLYGTTSYGGDLSTCNFLGCGVVFELSLLPNGRWSQKVLHTFTGPDGARPLGKLALDSAGSLYGATNQGGPGDGGIVYKLSQNPGGSWKETIVHSFAAIRFSNGWNTTSVALDTAGNVYGTNYYGGVSYDGPGNIFELSAAGQGWQETGLHNFTGYSDGAGAVAAPVFDSAGNLFGTTVYGGSGSNFGSIYKLTPSGNGWTFSTYYDFTIDIGETPRSSVLVDSAGNLYGTTENGGAFNMGAVYKIAP